jgi:hypothetical protein
MILTVQIETKDRFVICIYKYVTAYPFLVLKPKVMSYKITTVTIPVPYKSAGGVIHQHQVAFELYQVDGHYSLRPCLSPAERELANLPPELKFVMEKGKPVSLRGKIDGNFHVIKDVVVVLKEQHHL